MLAEVMDGLPPVELVWTETLGGEECICEKELGARLSTALGRPVVTGSTGDGQGSEVVSGTVGRATTGPGWEAVVEVRRGDSPPLRRVLRLVASDCRELDEAVVLVMALLVDSDVSTPPSLTIQSHAPAVSIAIGPDLAIATGRLPGVSFGFGLTGEAQIGRGFWAVSLSAHEWPLSRATVGASGGQMGAWTLGVGVCPFTPVGGSWEVFVCAGGSGGQVNSAGIGLDRARDNARAFVQVDAQIGARLRLASSLALRLALGSGVPIVRDRYAFVEADGTVREVFRTAGVVPMGQLSVEFRSSR